MTNLPLRELPPQLQEKVDHWLGSNKVPAGGVYHGIFPLGMVARWIQRAEQAEAENKGWRCFHCNEVFTDEVEAREHFGAEMYRDAACRLPVGADIKHIRGLEARVAELQRDYDRVENDARLWHESESDRVRQIGNVQWWQKLDEQEGERLVLAEKLEQAEAEVAHLRSQLKG